MHAKIWSTVFNLPQKFAAITIPFFTANRRTKTTKNSLVKIMKTTQTSINFKFKKHKRAATIKILSAKGSRNFPRFVIKFFFRAIYPSKKSVIEAIMKSRREIWLK